MRLKPFDNPLNLQDNYDSSDSYNDLMELIYQYSVNIRWFVESNINLFDGIYENIIDKLPANLFKNWLSMIWYKMKKLHYGFTAIFVIFGLNLNF